MPRRHDITLPVSTIFATAVDLQANRCSIERSLHQCSHGTESDEGRSDAEDEPFALVQNAPNFEEIETE